PEVSDSTPTRSPAAVAGRWASEREFILDLDTVSEVNHFVFRLTFAGEDLQIVVDEVTGQVKGLTIAAKAERTARCTAHTPDGDCPLALVQRRQRQAPD